MKKWTNETLKEVVDVVEKELVLYERPTSHGKYL
jgi:hypothetical protein